MKRRDCATLLGGALLGVAGALAWPETASPAGPPDGEFTVAQSGVVPALVSPEEARSADPHEVGHREKGVYNWITEAARQKYTLTDFLDLVVIDERWYAPDEEWKQLAHAESSSFDMLRAATAKEDVFCFAGFGRNGDFVIERWRLNPQTFSLPGGGTAQAVNEHGLAPKVFRKGEIFRGPLCDGVLGLEFDPEERFIMALVESGPTRILYSFENVLGAQPVVVLDSVSEPALAQMGDLSKLQHQAFGRVWMMSQNQAMTLRVALIDVDNDGVFDGQPLVGDKAWFESIGFDDYSLWDPLIGP